VAQGKGEIIVIGAGVGGMAAAIRLAVAGWPVRVLESNSYSGGKLAEITVYDIAKNAYRFDAGPSLFTQPSYLEELFTLAGEKLENWFTYTRLEEASRYFFSDGKRVVGYTDPARLAQELALVLGEQEQDVLAYLKRGETKFNLAGDIFLNNPINKLSTFLSPKGRKATARMGELDVLTTLHEVNRRTFTHKNTVQLFDRFATYNGSDPYQTSGIYSMISSFEHGEGAYYPTGGMRQIAIALEGLAVKLGVTFEYNVSVERIVLASKAKQSKRTIESVEAGGKLYPTQAVVSGLDVGQLYKRLLPEIKGPKRVLSAPLSSSGVVFYWGVNRVFEELGLHNVFFSEDYAAEFGAIFGTKTVPESPSVYVNISSIYSPGDAPEGAQNWFVMVNVPADATLLDEGKLAQLRKTILTRLEEGLRVDIEPYIVAEEVLTPARLVERTGALEGAIYGPDSNSMFSAFYRHANKATAVEGLYLAGGTVHPGGGIPLALKSGQLAVEAFFQDRAAN
jgi:diapolycopene oxygenase